MASSPSHRGFTLIELVLVLMLLALLFAAAAPSLSGWGRSQRVENAADQLLAAARWARSQAITTAMPHRLEIDSGGTGYVVTRLEGAGWAETTHDAGRRRSLPPGVQVSVEPITLATGAAPSTQAPNTPGVSASGSAVGFFPNGRITPVRVQITADSGRIIELQALGVAESLRRVEAEAP